MAVNLKLAEVPPREKRLKSVLSFHGSASELKQKSEDGTLSAKDRSFSQCGSCSSCSAFTLNAIIMDSAVVVHAPIGCSGDFANHNHGRHQGNRHRGLPSDNIKAICSNIQEKDTIYGASEKLRQAIREANERFHPKAIFVNTSCASGIIGENIDSVAEEMEEELGVKIVPIYCEGFRSKIWSTGFDATAHGIVSKLVKPATKKEDRIVNVFNFQGTHSFTGILNKIGLEPRYLFPFASVDDLEHMSEAVASTHICETLGTYVSAALEKEFGVPEVKAPVPYGISWTDEWLRELGRITDRSELVEQVIAEEHARIQPKLDDLRQKLGGKRVYILAGDSFVHSIVSSCRSLGMEVIGATAYHHDQVYDSDYGQINSLANMISFTGDVDNYTVCNIQPYEFTSILKDLKPDLLVVRHNHVATVGSKLGIPSFMVSDANLGIAYDGVIDLGYKLYETIRTKRMIETIAKHSKLPYTQWWSEQDPFYFEQGGK
ncbi:MAG: nitrogenase [Lachnospiraceae bacterium]|nr:nitrogenase [Lachnospiraceae bacterium]